jgi:hypothetical protein
MGIRRSPAWTAPFTPPLSFAHQCQIAMHEISLEELGRGERGRVEGLRAGAGHSPTFAAQHHWQARDAHFDLAAGVEEAAAHPATQPRTAAPNPHQPGDAFAATGSRKPTNQGVLMRSGSECDSVGARKTPAEAGVMPPEGLEPSTR